MGAMAVLGVALSGVGVYLIWRTWEATLVAARSSQRTLEAFKVAEGGTVLITLFCPPIDQRYEAPQSLACKLNIQKVGESVALKEVEWGIFETAQWPCVLPNTMNLQWGNITVKPYEDAAKFIIGAVKFETIFGTSLKPFIYEIGPTHESEGLRGTVYELELRHIDIAD